MRVCDAARPVASGAAHRVVSAELNLDTIAPFGPTQPVGLVRQGKRSVGVVWASPERDWLLTAGEWFATTLRIEHDGEVDDLPVSGDPRSVAMTPDRRAVVVASWFGGTRLLDVASGKSEVVLARDQAWIALSRTGELAWANDVAYGPGITCVVHLRPST